MYLPSIFHEQDQQAMVELIKSNNFGMLVTGTGDVPQVTHLPFILEEREGRRGVLYGHVARANPHWQSIRPGSRSLAIFQGPHSYISPSWYQDQGNVPTWNYTSCHVAGSVEVIHDREKILDIVNRLTDFHESGMTDPWRIDKAKNLHELLAAIVGLTMTIDSIEAKFKLSQNRSREDQLGVVDKLAESSHPVIKGVADLMRANLARDGRVSDA